MNILETINPTPKEIFYCDNCGKEYAKKELYEVDLDIYSYVCDCGYDNIYKNY